MAYTRAQYDALVAALATGALTVEYADNKTTFRSMADMLTLKREMEIDLGVIRRKSRKSVAVFSAGFGDFRMPGRGHIPRAAMSTEKRTITVFINAEPDPLQLIDTGGGVMIYAQYAPALTLKPIIYNTTTPFLSGKAVILPIFKNDQVQQLIPYNSVLGQFDNTAQGGFGDGDYITIEFVPNA